MILSRLDVISGRGSSVVKFLKDSDDDYRGFGEMYFSKVSSGVDRGWKIHSKATCNIMVPYGRVLFCVAQYNISSWRFVELGQEPAERLTIEPMSWYRFLNIESHDSIIANVIDIKHSDEQVDGGQAELMLNKPKAEVEWDKRTVKFPL